ncbi:zip zinc transporter family protein, putative [Ichthyophthirius multifiliis]|uniref:Zip zinc transporter family protein, putative n=1 Tax=Ichthyophthirius multifiliis TaxID=5932 RepID=G0QU07_ICHMU|nr:zip zinc transporter family protein, putative [Ichthyophthirius multifiliis]EGR31297.1 zip zinc transporter family protein, putative [Ichthyophthirius multifiliis]|eukprot:XP_004034783.1 zip zinc transporter family protein, putative [Ichthyophthirius multifiliis]
MQINKKNYININIYIYIYIQIIIIFNIFINKYYFISFHLQYFFFIFYIFYYFLLYQLLYFKLFKFFFFLTIYNYSFFYIYFQQYLFIFIIFFQIIKNYKYFFYTIKIQYSQKQNLQQYANQQSKTNKQYYQQKFNKIQQMEVWIIKLITFFTMFLIILLTGNIPLRVKSFKENPRIMSLSSAFAGGLFLSIGILHILPESQEQFQKYYQNQLPEQSHVQRNMQKENKQEYFPWPYFIIVISFALILFIDKVITGGHSNEEHNHIDQNLQEEDQSKKANFIEEKQQQLEKIQINQSSQEQKYISQLVRDEDSHIRMSLSKQKKQVEKIHQEIKKQDSQKNLKPYILQVAFGIHATLEGLAIGLENNWIKCLILVAAVLCHKWAEGITIGLSFKKANIDLKVASIMIIIQAVMNPIGVGIGWSLSNSGSLVMGIFMSISVGTFLYIATLEVLVEEFSDKRFRFEKFVFFLIAIGFVSSLWFLEQEIGHD